MARDPERKKGRRDEEEDARPADIEAELKELQGAWDESVPMEGGGDIPDGKYQAKVTKASLGKSKSSERTQIAYEFTIISGEYRKRKKWAYDGLETKENMDYAKGRLAALKLNIPKKMVDLEEVLEAAIGLTCEIQVKTRGDFQNVYVNKLIDIDAEGEGGDVAGGDEWEPSKRAKDKDRDRDDDRDEKPRRSRDEDDDKPKGRDRDRDDDRDEKPRRRDEEDKDEDKPRRSRDDDREDRAQRTRASEDDESDRRRSRDDDEKPRRSRDDDDDRPARKSKF